jgi:hypothetical protein
LTQEEKNAKKMKFVNIVRENLEPQIEKKVKKTLEEQAKKAKVEAKKAQMKKVKHVGYICDGCDKDIYGTRFKCLNQEDYDLCEECEPKFNKDFLMLRITDPKIMNKRNVGGMYEAVSQLWTQFGGQETLDDIMKKLTKMGVDTRVEEIPSIINSHRIKDFTHVLKSWNGEAVKLSFVNMRDEEVNLRWIDTQSKSICYGQILPNSTNKMNSYVGHQWVFSTKNGPVGGYRCEVKGLKKDQFVMVSIEKDGSVKEQVKTIQAPKAEKVFNYKLTGNEKAGDTVEVEVGPVWSHNDFLARKHEWENKFPGWSMTGHWWTTVPGKMSVVQFKKNGTVEEKKEEPMTLIEEMAKKLNEAKGDKKLFRTLAKEMLTNPNVDKNLVKEIIKNPGKKIADIAKDMLTESTLESISETKAQSTVETQKVEETSENDQIASLKVESLMEVFPQLKLEAVMEFVRENSAMELFDMILSIMSK